VSHNYLHNHKDFESLINIVARDNSIEPSLAEKDYWIMHCLYGLKKQGYQFELKGGTSLSKGFQLINRFSEDIDIQIEPPSGSKIKNHIERRKAFFESLVKEISIDGVEEVTRDPAFDDPEGKYRGAGIRLNYKKVFKEVKGVKSGILLEVGFDQVTPNEPVIISSWAYDTATASSDNDFIDNRAKDVLCYKPEYTFVEKLQTISTKHRRFLEEKLVPENFIRHYYDVYCLLEVEAIQNFIGTKEYLNHKDVRFRSADNKIISKNEAFILEDTETRSKYESAYNLTCALYYKDIPSFDEIMERIKSNIDRL